MNNLRDLHEHVAALEKASKRSDGVRKTVAPSVADEFDLQEEVSRAAERAATAFREKLNK